MLLSLETNIEDNHASSVYPLRLCIPRVSQVKECIIKNSLEIVMHIDNVKAYHLSNKNSRKEEISSRGNQSLSYNSVSLFNPEHNKCSMYCT